MDTYVQSLLCWGGFWYLFLQLSPEGPRAIPTAYRINFWHGMVSTAVAVACIAGLLDESVTVPCSLAYFLVDLCNMLLNDFVHRVASYQGPAARRAEYFHHLLCIVVCVTSKLYYKTACQSLTSDPVVRIMLAEVSTPFLITFRQTKSKLAGLFFVISFLLCRTVYQCLFLMPEIFVSCAHPGIKYGLVLPYILLQLYFTVEVLSRASKGEKTKSDGTGKNK